MNTPQRFRRVYRWTTALAVILLPLSAAAAHAQLTTHCTPGATQACIGAGITTAPAPGGGTDVTVRVANLQGTPMPNVMQVATAQLFGIDLIGPASFAGGPAGALTVTREGSAAAVADVGGRWGVYDVAEDGEYRGYVLLTDIDQGGADLVGCALPANLGYPYYRTCGEAGEVGAVVFRFTTPGVWTAGQLGVVFGLRVAGVTDTACEVPGTLWDAPDVPNCVTPGDAPPTTPIPQSISFTTSPPSPAYVGATSPVSATATSGLAVDFSSLTPGTCTVDDGTVSFAAAGPCTIAADQAGDASYLTAPQATQAVSIVRRPQVIALTPMPPASAHLGTSYTLGATGGGSGNPVTFTSLTPGICRMAGDLVSFDAVGPCTVAADQAGNATYLDAPQQRATIAVVWPFGGFEAPVAAAPVINPMEAGRAVPVKFSLGGDRGMAILAAGSPGSVAVACTDGYGTGKELDAISVGASTLTYDAATGLYTYVWKTERVWARSCRQLVLQLADGTTHTALFSFR